MASKRKSRRKVQSSRGITSSTSLKIDNKIRNVIVVLIILLVLGLLILNKTTKKGEELTTNDQGGDVAATQEAKLKEIYEKRAGTSLGDDFSARFSVFEDNQLGFRLAYPVGFVATPIGNGVIIKPDQGGGSVTVTVGEGSFNVETDKNGLSEKQQQIIEASSVFIRDSFQFIDNIDAQLLKDRFSGGPGKDRY